jgi:hypothetical protein
MITLGSHSTPEDMSFSRRRLSLNNRRPRGKRQADRISYQKQIIPILERPFQALSVSCSYDASMYVHFRYPW